MYLCMYIPLHNIYSIVTVTYSFFNFRLNVLRKRQHNLIIRIQTLWRLLYAKKRVRRIKKQRMNGIKLINIMKRLISRFRFRKRYKWQCQHLPYIICIQKYWRCAYIKRYISRLLSNKRQYSEIQQYINIRFNQLLAAVQLQILRETMIVPIGKNMGFIAIFYIDMIGFIAICYMLYYYDGFYCYMLYYNDGFYCYMLYYYDGFYFYMLYYYDGFYCYMLYYFMLLSIKSYIILTKLCKHSFFSFYYFIY